MLKFVLTKYLFLELYVLIMHYDIVHRFLSRGLLKLFLVVEVIGQNGYDDNLICLFLEQNKDLIR